MIFKNRILPIICFAVFGSTLYGQDLHFTQFNLAPLTFNPALSGAFYGTVRIGGVYRDQWGSSYSTPAFYVDSPILRGFRKLDWIGVGLSVTSDKGTAEYVPFQSGGGSQGHTGTLSTGGALGSIAYHFSLDDKRNTVIALGIQGGTLARKVRDEFEFEDQLLNGGVSMDMLPTDMNDSKSILDVSAGLTLTSKTVGESYLRVGVSTMHINRPRTSILGSGGGKLPMRIVGYGTYHWDVNEKFLVLPSVLYQTMGPASELSMQGMAGYKMPKENLILKGGLGYRVGDALAILVGADYKDVRVGLSYDINASELSSPNSSFEIGVAYIAKIYKRPKVDPVIFCPRF
ncbi:MAG: PorP/SprF family type IX secretion system membrane protein [Saprospiraceae bacterium]|nr:PorP/SprF family type IX secretion system membrane protein [Saprospiraceae bacterium]